MDGLGKATLLTALDLSGLNQGFDQAKADTKKFAQDASKELDNVKQSANEIANAKGLKELQTQIDDVRVRAKAAAQGVVIENGKIDASFNETGRQAGRMGQRVRDELDKSESRARRFATAVKTAIAAAVTVEAAKNIIGFLVDSAEKADEASESFSAQRVATENLTAAQDAFQIMIGQKVTPALATANTVYATMLELISGGIDLSNGLAANTETMGSNFATAANDAQPLNTQLATIADRAANITIALAGVGQVSTGLVQVVGAPFAALGSFIGDTLAQVELATEAIKALGSFEFGIAKSNSQAIATIERDKLGNAASAAGASALEGFSNFQEGFTKLFSSEEIKANLSANILSGLQDASTKIEASQYAKTLESSSSSAAKSGVKKGIEEAVKEVELEIKATVSVELPSAVFGSSVSGASNPAVTRNLTPQTPNTRLPQTPALGAPDVPVFFEPFQEFRPVGLPVNPSQTFTRDSPINTRNQPPARGRVEGLDLTLVPDVYPIEQVFTQTVTDFIRDVTIPIADATVSVLEARGVVPDVSVSVPNARNVVPFNNVVRGVQVDTVPLSERFRNPITGGARVTAPPSFSGTAASLLEDQRFDIDLRNEEASKAQVEAAEDAAEKQRQAAQDFALTVIDSASQFGNAVLSIASGDIGSGISQLGGAIGGVIGAANPILGAGISAGAGFLGGFIDLITRNDDEAEARNRAQQSRSVPAIQIVTNLEQNNNITYQGSSDPQVAANNNALAGQILTAIESNIIPRLERLELQVAS